MFEIIRRYDEAHTLEHELYVKDTTRSLPANFQLLWLNMLYGMVLEHMDWLNTSCMYLPEDEALVLRMLRQEAEQVAIRASVSQRNALRQNVERTAESAVEYVSLADKLCAEILDVARSTRQ
jgi:hypothetical protein